MLVGEKDTQYRGWVRVTDSKGHIGWAPLECIQLLGRGPGGIELRVYSAKELNIDPHGRLIVNTSTAIGAGSVKLP